MSLPTGTVTFLFTDIEGSTRLLQHLGPRYADLLADQRRLLRAAFDQWSGHELGTEGDSFFVAFSRATDALAAVVEAQRALAAHSWPDGVAVRVRMGLHTGEPTLTPEGYIGLDVHRAARISAAGHGGQVLLSRTTRELVAQDLPEGASLRDLGEHRLKDLRQPEGIYQLVHPDLPADFPPLKSLDVLPNNLPRQLTSFIGREREMAEVKRHLATTALLTLTGAGGSGKTRLALQVAADLLEEYPNGVWLVELAALTDPGLAPQAVAMAVGVREEPGRPLTATLIDHLRPKKLLLVLDNCEHLVGACATLAHELLQACPNLRVLATSREALGIGGETVWRVPSLSLPDIHQVPRAGANLVPGLTQYEAVRLFIERGVAVLPSFTVTNTNAPAVAEVCHRLDGIPLAIELAAARVKALPVEKIAERLDDRFRLLTGGSRTALPRQQTLRALIDWSYDLLQEQERALLRRLSVFLGGWTLEAAEAVGAGDGVEEWEVLDLLTHLVEKSLVVYEEQEGEARYRLLETVRQYARDQLLESGEGEAAWGRHRDYFLQFAERAARELGSVEQVEWLEGLEAEHDNLRAALGWCQDAGVALRLALALGEFWDARGYRSEGLGTLQQILARGAGAPSELRARAQMSAGSLAVRLGEYESARVLLEESLTLYRDAGDRPGIASALTRLGHLEGQRGYLQGAQAYLQEGLEIQREVGDKRAEAETLMCLGTVMRARRENAAARACLEEALALERQFGNKRAVARGLVNLGGQAVIEGDHATAHVLLEESLAGYREVGDRGGVAVVLGNLRVIAYIEGDYVGAAALGEESVAIWGEIGEKNYLASELIELGWAALAQGDLARARARGLEGLAILRGLKDLGRTPRGLEFFAHLAARQQLATRAARLWGAAEALREAADAPPRPDDEDRAVAAARDALGEEAFDAAWAEGRVMPLDEAIRFALEVGSDD